MEYRQPFEGFYPITQHYGETITDKDGHTGIDYALPEGTPVLASEAGTVVLASWYSGGWGYSVILQHADGNATLYAHLQSTAVSVGEKVTRGQLIGRSGWTGNVVPKGPEGAHLHFEARRTAMDFKSHFDPMTLPLHSVDDTIGQPKPAQLKGADQLAEDVVIVAPAGAWGWAPDFSIRKTVFLNGTRLHFTGKTTQRLGYTYCEVYEEPPKYWVAVHDNQVQILDNTER